LAPSSSLIRIREDDARTPLRRRRYRGGGAAAAGALNEMRAADQCRY